MAMGHRRRLKIPHKASWKMHNVYFMCVMLNNIRNNDNNIVRFAHILEDALEDESKIQDVEVVLEGECTPRLWK